jgi:DNA-binding CsgD family transcriptional regulator
MQVKEKRSVEVGMSTLSRVEFLARDESKSKSSTAGPRLLFCGPTGKGQPNLEQLNQADVCAVDIRSAGELSSALSAIAPDLVVLSLEAVRRLLSDKTFVLNSAEDLEYALSGLRTRHADIIRMMAKGLRNHEIANSLGLSSRTVKAILSSLYLHYDVTNRTELLGLLMEQGHLAAAQVYPMPVLERDALRNAKPTIVSGNQKIQPA